MFSMTPSRVLIAVATMAAAAGQINAQNRYTDVPPARIDNSENRPLPPPVPPSTEPSSRWLGEQPAASSGSLIEQLRQASDPSAAISLYAEAARSSPDDLTAETALVERMITFGMPALAEQQARKIVERDPNRGAAWAVLADAAGRRGETDAALGHTAKAVRVSPDDPFVQQTASKLLAWFDQQADPSKITSAMDASANFIRTAMTGRDGFRQSYDEAVAFYREAARMQQEQRTQPPDEQAVPGRQEETLYEGPYGQPQAEATAPPGEQPLENNYYTYNTYYTTPEYDTYAMGYGGYAAPYYGYYGSPYYDYYGSPYYSYYGYATPSFFYGGYYWPCYSTFIVAPSFWPRYHNFSHGLFSHGYYPRFFTHYGSKHGVFGFDGWRYGHDRFGDRRFGGSRGTIDRFTSPSIPRSVARDWSRGTTANPSIPRGTFDRGIPGRTGIASASVPRGTFDRGTVNRSGPASASIPRGTIDRGTVGRAGTSSASVPRGSFNRGAVSRSGTSSASIPRLSVSVPRASGSNTFGFVSPSVPRSSVNVTRPSGTSRSLSRSPQTITRSPQTITRSTVPRSSGTVRSMTPSRGIASRSPAVSIPRSSGSSPRMNASRGISVPRSSSFSRGFSSPRPSRSIAAAPRPSVGRSSPSIARGGFSRGGGGAISRGGGGFSRGGGAGIARGGAARGGGGRR